MSVLLLLMVAWAGPRERALVDAFVEEAAARGVHLEPRVRVRFARWLDDAGFCREERVPVVFLDRSVWRELDEPAREALLFHELGHCLLDAEHDNTRTPSGEWASLMRGGDLAPGKRAWLRFEGAHRTAYLDALFGGPTPSWGGDPPAATGERVPTESETWRGASGLASRLAVDEDFTAVHLELEPPAVASKGLLLFADRTVYVGLHAERGVELGTLEDTRPWGNVPGAVGAVWARMQGEELWLGADTEVHMRIPADELGAITAVGAYGLGETDRVELRVAD